MAAARNTAPGTRLKNCEGEEAHGPCGPRWRYQRVCFCAVALAESQTPSCFLTNNPQFRLLVDVMLPSLKEIVSTIYVVCHDL